jgi:hypothetical protein
MAGSWFPWLHLSELRRAQAALPCSNIAAARGVNVKRSPPTMGRMAACVGRNRRHLFFMAGALLAGNIRCTDRFDPIAGPRISIVNSNQKY